MSTIRAQSLRRAAPFLLAAAWLGCTNDEPTAPKPASQSLASLRIITGRLLGPDGRSICRTVPKDTMLVTLLNPDFDGSNDPFLELQGVACPDNSFALGLDATTARLRVELPLSQDINRLPWRSLDEFTVPLG